jgi:hypothetical protein
MHQPCFTVLILGCALVQAPVKKPRWESELSLEEVFTKLGLSEYTAAFTSLGITITELEACTEDDLKV